MAKPSLVLKVGGSLLYNENDDLNLDFLEKLSSWYKSFLKQYDRIFLFVGGGKFSRNIVSGASGYLTENWEKHSVSMSATQINAQIVRSVLSHNSSIEDIFTPTSLGEAYEFAMQSEGRFMVSGGLKLGWSTDMCAVVFADILSVERAYKLSNIDCLYDKDPAVFKDATPIMDITWQEYFKIFGVVEGESVHQPNLHIPIDVTCAQFAKKKGISFFVSGGKNIGTIANPSELVQSGTYLHN